MSPWGYLYMSTFSMDGRDWFDPTMDIAHPKFFIQISKCRFVWNTLEYAQGKSREIRRILKQSMTSFPTYSDDVLVAFLSSKDWICAFNCHMFWISSQLALILGRSFHLTGSSCLVVRWNATPHDWPGLPLLHRHVGLWSPRVPDERYFYLDPLHLHDKAWVDLHGRLGGTWSLDTTPPYKLVPPAS